jgi:hypothetical protein
MATNAELTAENEILREENDDLRARLDELQAAGAPATAPAPVLPSFGMSEGTRQEIIAAQTRLAAEPRLDEVVVVEPFTGKSITVTESTDVDNARLDDDRELATDDERALLEQYPTP